MNDRQFYALNMPARTIELSTDADYQDIIRARTGDLILTVLTVDMYAKVPRPTWHAAAFVLHPRTREIVPLNAIPLRLHADLRTIVAKLLLGVGKDPSNIHPRGLGWHCYRECTVLEAARIPEPPVDVATPPPEPLILRPDGPTIDLAAAGFTAADLVPAAEGPSDTGNDGERG